MKAVITCVDYGDLLARTLPYNKHHFSEILIVTTSVDTATIQVAKQHGVGLCFTDTFYEDNAPFNKAKAIEHGLDAIGRNGWLCLMDADIVWPKHLSSYQLDPQALYAPRRRLQLTYGETRFLPESTWHLYPLYNEYDFGTYALLLHAASRYLPSTGAWHPSVWPLAGGNPQGIDKRWPALMRLWLPWQVLHLGAPGINWCGRVTPYANGQRPAQASQRAQRLRAALAAGSRARAAGTQPGRPGPYGAACSPTAAKNKTPQGGRH